jgi:hypothetical protein
MLKCIYAATVIHVVLLCFADTGLAADDGDYASPISLSTSYLAAAPPAGGGSVARDTGFRFRAWGVFSNADGRLTFDDEFPLINNEIDFERTLGLDLEEFNGGALIGFNFGSQKRWHFDIGFDGYYDYDGTRNVGSIEFNGRVFTAEVESNLQIIETFASINYDLWMSDAEDLTLNLGLDFHLYYVKAELEEVFGTESDDATLWAPIPAPSIALRWDVTPNFYLRGKAAGIWLGDLGDFYDLSAEVGYDFNRNIGVFAGYRFWDLHFEYSDWELDYDTSRVYAGVELRM